MMQTSSARPIRWERVQRAANEGPHQAGAAAERGQPLHGCASAGPVVQRGGEDEKDEQKDETAGDEKQMAAMTSAGRQ
jgi:hypothetical protein